MSTHEVSARIQRFAGDRGWWYVALDDRLSAELRPRVNHVWPSLLKANCSVGATTWRATVMPISDGPLFIALPKQVRVQEGLDVGDPVVVRVRLDPEPRTEHPLTDG